VEKNSMTKNRGNDGSEKWIEKKLQHQIPLLLMEHRASMKSFQALWSPATPLTSFIIFLCFLSHPLLSFTTFCLAYLSFYIPEDSNIMQLSLLLLFLCVMCARMNFIIKYCMTWSCDNCMNFYWPLGCWSLNCVVCRWIYCLTGW